MPNPTSRLLALFLTLAVCGPAARLAGADEVELDFKKALRAARQAPPQRVARPAAPAPPAELILETEEGKALDATGNEAKDPAIVTPEPRRRRQGGSGNEPPAPAPAPTPVDGELDRRAAEAASDQVRRAIDLGRRQAFEVGFYRGMRLAVDDERLGHWARLDGQRDGRSDPAARRQGEEQGRSAAEAQAAASAAEDVEAQFLDLSSEPFPRPRAASPPWTSGGYAIAEPQLDDVFRELAPSTRLSAEPWALYRVSSSRQIGDDRWRDPEWALRDWLDDRRRRAFYGALAPEEQRRFREVFVARFRAGIRRLGDDLSRAHGRGFEAGWDYGATVREEHSWRQGYRDGYAEALALSAEDGWHEAFPRLYRAAYDAEFEQWATRPHPELGDLRIEDADADGVVSPGEPIRLHYSVVNYGGGTGRLTARLDAPELDDPVDRLILVPRRREIDGEPLAARIDPRVKPRTIADLRLTLAEAEARLPVRIAFPLELDGQVELEGHDTLAGRATLAVTLGNHSRREVAAEVVARFDGREVPARELLGRLAAGATRRLRFELDGLRPLDLLAGNAAVEIVASSRGAVHDQVGYRFPTFALDLSSSDLLDVLFALAREAYPPPADVRETHRLVLEQLRRDYEVAAAGSGNPYRDDRGSATAATALGRLVAAYRAQRHELRRPEVVTSLRPQIEALTESLPGLHPFLKSQMKKLARELR